VVRLTTRVGVPVVGWAVAHVVARHIVAPHIIRTEIVAPHIIRTEIVAPHIVTTEIVAPHIVAPHVVSDAAVSDVTVGRPYVVLGYASVVVRFIGCPSRTRICNTTAPRIGVKTICLTQCLLNLRAGLSCPLTLLSRRRLQAISLGTGVLGLCGHGVGFGLFSIQFCCPFGRLLPDLLCPCPARSRGPAIQQHEYHYGQDHDDYRDNNPCGDTHLSPFYPAD
jgi:hypothetical protein